MAAASLEFHLPEFDLGDDELNALDGGRDPHVVSGSKPVGRNQTARGEQNLTDPAGADARCVGSCQAGDGVTIAAERFN